MRQPRPAPPTFAFHARWREELVCTAAGGSFVLELAMGKLTAYLPTEDAWPTCAPAWALALWPVLHAELQAWCQASDAGLVVVADARVGDVAS